MSHWTATRQHGLVFTMLKFSSRLDERTVNNFTVDLTDELNTLTLK